MSKRLDILGKIATFLETRKKRIYTPSEIAREVELHQDVVKDTFQTALFIKENFPEFSLQSDIKKKKDSCYIIFEDNEGELVKLTKKQISLSEKMLKRLGRRS